MGKITVRVKYPTRSAEKLLVLFNDITRQHKKLGAESPLNNLSWLNMEQFETLANEARLKRDESIDLRAKSESLMMQSNNLIGLNVGQTNGTPGTLLYMMTAIRNSLLIYHKENSEALSEYGFGVVVREVRLPKKKKKLSEK